MRIATLFVGALMLTGCVANSSVSLFLSNLADRRAELIPQDLIELACDKAYEVNLTDRQTYCDVKLLLSDRKTVEMFSVERPSYLLGDELMHLKRQHWFGPAKVRTTLASNERSMVKLEEEFFELINRTYANAKKQQAAFSLQREVAEQRAYELRIRGPAAAQP